MGDERQGHLGELLVDAMDGGCQKGSDGGCLG